MNIEIIKENLKKHASESVQGMLWAQRYKNYCLMKEIESMSYEEYVNANKFDCSPVTESFLTVHLEK